MSSFESAIGVVLKHEGGWVDNPKDYGGETNFGISTLIIKREGITPEFIGLVGPPSPGWLVPMKVEAAEKVYRQLFWDRFHYGGFISQDVATKIFDCAVNCGPSNAHRMAQRSAATLGILCDVDGLLGGRTFAAVNACDPPQFMREMRGQMETHYLSLIEKDPTQVVFKSNWMKRAAWGTLP